MTDTPVSGIGPGGIEANGKKIPAANVIWAAGVRADLPPGVPGETDRAGRPKVDGSLRLPGHGNIFCIGDAAYFEQDGAPLPGVAAVAKQQGAHVAKVIRAQLKDRRAPEPFRYRNPGMLATIGRNSAVADLGGIRFKGWLAWMFWGLIHIFFLIGFRSRVLVFWNWVWAWLTYGRGARLILGQDPEASDG